MRRLFFDLPCVFIGCESMAIVAPPIDVGTARTYGPEPPLSPPCKCAQLLRSNVKPASLVGDCEDPECSEIIRIRSVWRVRSVATTD